MSEEAATVAHTEAVDQPVPGLKTAGPDLQPDTSRDDDTLTTPLPAILPGATSVPRPAPVEEPRGFFEPARPDNRAVSVTGAVEPPPEPYLPDGERPLSKAASDKLDQLKDLYLTAEAIGENRLDKHFDQVSERQRELIKEFFERSEPGYGQQG